MSKNEVKIDPKVKTTTYSAVTLPINNTDTNNYIDKFNKEQEKFGKLIDKINEKINKEEQKANRVWKYFRR